MSALKFISANESLLVTTLRASELYPEITNKHQASACRKLVATLDEDAQLALAVSMGYDPDAVVTEPAVEEIVVPSDIKILTWTNPKGGQSKYAKLPFIRMSSAGAYAVCKYGNTEVYARIGTSIANQYFLARKLSNTPLVEGELIHVTMESGTLVRETEGAMKTLWVSAVHTSSMEACQNIIASNANQLTRTDEITIAVASGQTHKEAVATVQRERAEDATNAIKKARALVNKNANTLLGILG